MNFKKYNEMELALLSAIANLTAEDVKDISIEKGDIVSVAMKDYDSVPSYLHKPDSAHHALRRKNTFHKKEERKELAQSLGYDLSYERNDKKVKSVLSANHVDRAYFRGSKTKRKNMSVKEEVSMMEQEIVENAREAMMKEHNSIIGSVMQDIDTLMMDMKSNDRSIENLESDYKELEEAMKVVSEKLQNANLKRNGIMAAMAHKECELDTMSKKLTAERISRFGW